MEKYELFFKLFRCPKIKDGFSGQFCHIFEIIIFRFVVAISDLVHDAKAIHSLYLLLAKFGNLF